LVRSEMGEWLSTFPWDWWCTLTFRNEYSPDAATRAFLRLTDWLRKDSPGVGYFVGHEVGRLGRLHLHALIGGLEPYVQRTAAAKRWDRRHGHARIFPYDPDRGASHYIAKYVSKELAEWDIHAVGTPGASLLRRASVRRPGRPSRIAVSPPSSPRRTTVTPLRQDHESRSGTHKYPKKAYLGTFGGPENTLETPPNDPDRTRLDLLHAPARPCVEIPNLPERVVC